jgi:hypothetical protein
MKLEFSQRIFEKYSNIKLHENPSSGSRIVLCRQPGGRRDMTKPIAAFRNFANAQTNYTYEFVYKGYISPLSWILLLNFNLVTMIWTVLNELRIRRSTAVVARRNTLVHTIDCTMCCIYVCGYECIFGLETAPTNTPRILVNLCSVNLNCT